MRVLVDTSVWSRTLRREPRLTDPVVRRLQGLLGKADIVLTGLVLQEILQAFRAESDLRRVTRQLEAFPLLQLGRGDYAAAARIHRECAKHGVGTSTADCQIAAAAIGHRCALLSADEDFTRIARHVALRLL